MEAWGASPGSKTIGKYSLVYANLKVFQKDNGRILGYDNAHLYPGFTTFHHKHYNGLVTPNHSFTTFDDLLAQFHQELLTLKQLYGEDY